MKSFLFACLASLFLPLAACATLSTSGQHQIIYSCAAATAAVQTLTVFHNKLSPSDIKTVNIALEVTTPICSAKTAPTYSDAVIAELNNAVNQLQLAAGKYK